MRRRGFGPASWLFNFQSCYVLDLIRDPGLKAAIVRVALGPGSGPGLSPLIPSECLLVAPPLS